MSNLILTAALKGTVVLGVAWMATTLLRQGSADLRHKIWLAALMATALLLIPWPAPAPTGFVATAELGTGRITSAASRSLPAIPVLPVLWMIGAALCLFRFGAGVSRLRRITRQSRPAGAVRISDSIRTPMTWGAIKPVILLPAYVEDWPLEQREVVIRHESAHIERRDWLWQTFAHVMTAVFWFHPLVWLAAAKLREEAEHATDDRTLSGGIRASDYADRLLAVASQLRSASPAAAVASGVAMVRKPALTSRIAAILDSSRTRTGASVRARIGVALAVGALVIPLGAFQNRPVYRVGQDGVSAPKVVYRSQPQYTPEAKAAKIQGTVVLNAVVNAAGRAEDITVTRSLDPGLDTNTILALTKWIFEPGIKDGQPVDVSVTIEVNFKLQ